MSIVWKADATRPIEEEFCAMGTPTYSGPTYVKQNNPNLYQVADQSAPNGRAYRCAWTSGTKQGKYGLRSEAQMGNPAKKMTDGIDRGFHEGQERWISAMFKLDSNFPTSGPVQSPSIMQLTHPAASDGGLFNLGCGGRNGGMRDQWLVWGYTRVGPGNDTPCHEWALGPIAPTRGKWVKFTFHILCTTSNKGFFEVYSDLLNPGGNMTLLFVKTGVPTIKSGRPYSFATFGFYASNSTPVQAGCSLAGFTCATDRVSAEESAFGKVVTPPPPTTVVASFTATPNPARTGTVVTFDASASQGGVNYKWEDIGTKPVTLLGSGVSYSRAFHFVGTKKVKLTVDDGSGVSSTVEHDLVIT